jgi:TPR repeat protein
MHLGEAFDNGLGDLEADARVSLAYYRLACQRGEGEGCRRAATIVLDGSANFSDPNVALDYARRGCDELKDNDACPAMAMALQRGGGTADEQARAPAIIDAACDKGVDDGCRLKAHRLLYESNDAASQATAIPLLERACAAKSAWGCSGLTDAYENGWGVAKDHGKAMDYAATGCTQGRGDRLVVCRQHGMYLTYSQDKTQINAGEQYLNTACMANDSGACAWLGRLGLRDKQGATTTMEEGLYYERRACDLENTDGCNELGLAYAIGNGINPDAPVAVALYDRSCKLGSQEGCDAAADLVAADSSVRSRIPAIDPSLPSGEQIALAVQAKDNGDPTLAPETTYRLSNEDKEEAEWVLGGWMYYGLPEVFDPPRPDDGVILIENAARVGHVDAAIWIGMAYWYGDGVEQDQDKGMQYMAIAASRGSREAADIYSSMQNEGERQEMAQRAYDMAHPPQKSVWEQAMDAWDAALRNQSYSMTSSSYGTGYSGPSVSDTINELNWNQRFDYLSGATTACPSSNPYCI